MSLRNLTQVIAGRCPGATQGLFWPFLARAGGSHLIVWSVDAREY
jgi:hypothetical protein